MKDTYPLFTTAKAATYLEVSKSYLYKLMMWRKIPFFKPRGKVCFFHKEDLDNYNRKNRVLSEDELEQNAETYLMNKRVNDRGKSSEGNFLFFLENFSGLLLTYLKECSHSKKGVYFLRLYFKLSNLFTYFFPIF